MRSFDDLGRVFCTPLQARAQLFPAGRQDEDQHGVGENAFDLDGALKIDLQHHVGPLGDALFDGVFGCAVAVAVHLGPFQKRFWMTIWSKVSFDTK